MIGIYKITNKINGKFYIGQSINIERRFCDHRCISHETNIHLRNALIKYGKDNFLFEVLEECNIDELGEREIFYIKTLKPHYNIANGGKSHGKHSLETKQKLSLKGKQQWLLKSVEEKKYLIQNNLKGRAKGHTVSDETRKKLRDCNLGKKQSSETINKRKETIRLLKLNGYVQDNKSHRKKIIRLEDGKIYESVLDAGKDIGVHPSNVTSVLKGRQKTTKGYHYQYLKV